MREIQTPQIKTGNEERTKKVFGVPLTENMRIGIRYLGPIVAIAALELSLGFYQEYKRTSKIHEPTPAVAQPKSQTTDMPVPDYRWATPLRKAVEQLSKGSEYTGQ